MAEGGTSPAHYALGYQGARLRAARREDTPPRPGAWQQHLERLAESPTLRHRLGITTWFIDLATTTPDHPHTPTPTRPRIPSPRPRPAAPPATPPPCSGVPVGGVGLTLWLSERRTDKFFCFHGHYPLRPDGYGCWHEPDRHVLFFLEYDLGTEPHHTLITKLDQYAQINTRRYGVVLFWLPTTTRETHLREHMLDEVAGSHHDGVRSPLLAATAAHRWPFTIATAATDAGRPTDPIWAPWPPPATGHPTPRLRIGQLPPTGPPLTLAPWNNDAPFTQALYPAPDPLHDLAPRPDPPPPAPPHASAPPPPVQHDTYLDNLYRHPPPGLDRFGNDAREPHHSHNHAYGGPGYGTPSHLDDDADPL